MFDNLVVLINSKAHQIIQTAAKSLDLTLTHWEEKEGKRPVHSVTSSSPGTHSPGTSGTCTGRWKRGGGVLLVTMHTVPGSPYFIKLN